MYVSSEASGWGTSPTMEAHVVFFTSRSFQDRQFAKGNPRGMYWMCS